MKCICVTFEIDPSGKTKNGKGTWWVSSHKIKKVESFTTNFIMDVVPFVSTEQYPTSVSVVTDLNFSIQPNEAETFCYSMYIHNPTYTFSILSNWLKRKGMGLPGSNCTAIKIVYHIISIYFVYWRIQLTNN